MHFTGGTGGSEHLRNHALITPCGMEEPGLEPTRLTPMAGHLTFTLAQAQLLGGVRGKLSFPRDLAKTLLSIGPLHLFLGALPLPWERLTAWGSGSERHRKRLWED